MWETTAYATRNFKLTLGVVLVNIEVNGPQLIQK